MLTGKIHTKPTTKEYEDNWDKIFGKKKEEGGLEPKPKKEEECDNCSHCECGK
jgi:hypothetical protein